MKKILLLCALLALSACAGADGRVDVLGTAGAGAVAGGIAGLVDGAIARTSRARLSGAAAMARLRLLCVPARLRALLIRG